MKKIFTLLCFLFLNATLFVHWKQISPTPTDMALYSIYFVDSNIGYAVGP